MTSIDVESVLCALNWLMLNTNVRVANMSFGGGGYADDHNCGYTNGDRLHQAICQAADRGLTAVAAAGNSAVAFTPDINPANYDEVITVTWMNDTDGLSGGAGLDAATFCGRAELNYGRDDWRAYKPRVGPNAGPSGSNYPARSDTSELAHTVAAPGTCVYTTQAGLTTYDRASYAHRTGSSFAAPFVTGAVALCLESGACRTLTARQIVAKFDQDSYSYNATNSSYGFVGDPWRPPPDDSSDPEDPAGADYETLIQVGMY